MDLQVNEFQCDSQLMRSLSATAGIYANVFLEQPGALWQCSLEQRNILRNTENKTVTLHCTELEEQEQNQAHQPIVIISKRRNCLESGLRSRHADQIWKAGLIGYLRNFGSKELIKNSEKTVTNRHLDANVVPTVKPYRKIRGGPLAVDEEKKVLQQTQDVRG